MHNNLYMFIVDGNNTRYDDITDGSPENEFDMMKINKEKLLSWSRTKKPMISNFVTIILSLE